jgi:hypothetical protein
MQVERKEEERQRQYEAGASSVLADADIVLTFDALMSGFRPLDENRFITGAPGTAQAVTYVQAEATVSSIPPTSIRWCESCDERSALNPTAGSARMALKLEAGSSVGSGGDTHWTEASLKICTVYCCFFEWTHFRQAVVQVLLPCHRFIDERIRCLLKDIFWLTKSLDTVRDQMGVPEQIEKRVSHSRRLRSTFTTDSWSILFLSQGNWLIGESRRKQASQLDLLAEHRLRQPVAIHKLDLRGKAKRTCGR